MFTSSDRLFVTHLNYPIFDFTIFDIRSLCTVFYVSARHCSNDFTIYGPTGAGILITAVFFHRPEK
jgi:hypothetical protein